MAQYTTGRGEAFGNCFLGETRWPSALILQMAAYKPEYSSSKGLFFLAQCPLE